MKVQNDNDPWGVMYISHGGVDIFSYITFLHQRHIYWSYSYQVGYMSLDIKYITIYKISIENERHMGWAENGDLRPNVSGFVLSILGHMLPWG
jgi:hypothetical protein